VTQVEGRPAPRAAAFQPDGWVGQVISTFSGAVVRRMQRLPGTGSHDGFDWLACLRMHVVSSPDWCVSLLGQANGWCRPAGTAREGGSQTCSRTRARKGTAVRPQQGKGWRYPQLSVAKSARWPGDWLAAAAAEEGLARGEIMARLPVCTARPQGGDQHWD
jgi:hypothetical protein